MARPHFLRDPEHVVAIREMAFAGMAYAAIGYEFFVSHVAVSDIANGFSYPYAGGPIRHRDYDTERFVWGRFDEAIGRERARR